MKLHVVAIAGLTTLSAANAHADQCAYVSKKVADAGAKVIKAAQSTASFCQPCGDTLPGKRVKVETVEVRQVPPMTKSGPIYFEVLVNGVGVDLAYTYAQRGKDKSNPHTLENVGLKVNCGAQGVSARWPDGPEIEGGSD